MKQVLQEVQQHLGLLRLFTNPGSYRFVFVSGTFDFSGGKWAGAQLYVDNVSVTESIPAPATITDGMVQAIARKVKYESTSDNPPASKTLTVKGTSINGIVERNSNLRDWHPRH